MKANNFSKAGIIYAAFGYEYLLMAIYSAKTVKENNPGIICELVTNIPININKDNNEIKNLSVFDSIKQIEIDSKLNRLIKTNIIEFASFDIGVYLDCDTEIRGSLSPIFNCLERFDIAVKMGANPTSKDYEISKGIHGHFFPVFNGGVIFFKKNDKTKTFFKKWNEIYKAEEKTSDQPALARAIFETKDLNVLSLNAVWNTFLGEEVIILKYRKLSKKSLKWLKNSIIWHYRKPEEWPYIVPSLYNIHKELKKSIINPKEQILKEIKTIEKKYELFSTPFYRFIFNKPLLLKILEVSLKILNKLGFIENINLKREKKIFGKRYGRIKSN